MVLNHPKCGIQPFKLGVCRGYHGGSPPVSANNLWMLDIVVFDDQNVYGLDVEKPAMNVPSRNLSHNYGLNHPAINGKISYTWPFSIAMYQNDQRRFPIDPFQVDFPLGKCPKYFNITSVSHNQSVDHIPVVKSMRNGH